MFHLYDDENAPMDFMDLGELYRHVVHLVELELHEVNSVVVDFTVEPVVAE